MIIDERFVGVGRRLLKERRCGVDARSEDERWTVGERRSGRDRRSHLDRLPNTSQGTNGHRQPQVYTFLPVTGGAGATTLAVETAILLLKSEPKRRSSTCLVDLDFQGGACADYLDVEPHLNLNEITSVERLDSQLMEVMISRHASGLAVIAAPHGPAVECAFDERAVLRLLDLIATRFEFIVIDMPRGWFPWTGSVLLGSDKLFVVSRASVPSLRRSRELVAAIEKRAPSGPKPQVLVNSYDRRILSSALSHKEFEKVFGKAFAGTVPCDHALAREAIDRGVPLNEIKVNNSVTRAVKKMVLPKMSNQRAWRFVSLSSKLSLW